LELYEAHPAAEMRTSRTEGLPGEPQVRCIKAMMQEHQARSIKRTMGRLQARFTVALAPRRKQRTIRCTVRIFLTKRFRKRGQSHTMYVVSVVMFSAHTDTYSVTNPLREAHLSSM
jgi:hypothetical protein